MGNEGNCWVSRSDASWNIASNGMWRCWFWTFFWALLPATICFRLPFGSSAYFPQNKRTKLPWKIWNTVKKTLASVVRIRPVIDSVSKNFWGPKIMFKKLAIIVILECGAPNGVWWACGSTSPADRGLTSVGTINKPFNFDSLDLSHRPNPLLLCCVRWLLVSRSFVQSYRLFISYLKHWFAGKRTTMWIALVLASEKGIRSGIEWQESNPPRPLLADRLFNLNEAQIGRAKHVLKKENNLQRRHRKQWRPKQIVFFCFSTLRFFISSSVEFEFRGYDETSNGHIQTFSWPFGSEAQAEGGNESLGISMAALLLVGPREQDFEAAGIVKRQEQKWEDVLLRQPVSQKNSPCLEWNWPCADHLEGISVSSARSRLKTCWARSKRLWPTQNLCMSDKDRKLKVFLGLNVFVSNLKQICLVILFQFVFPLHWSRWCSVLSKSLKVTDEKMERQKWSNN